MSSACDSLIDQTPPRPPSSPVLVWGWCCICVQWLATSSDMQTICCVNDKQSCDRVTSTCSWHLPLFNTITKWFRNYTDGILDNGVSATGIRFYLYLITTGAKKQEIRLCSRCKYRQAIRFGRASAKQGRYKVKEERHIFKVSLIALNRS